MCWTVFKNILTDYKLLESNIQQLITTCSFYMHIYPTTWSYSAGYFLYSNLLTKSYLLTRNIVRREYSRKGVALVLQILVDTYIFHQIQRLSGTRCTWILPYKPAPGQILPSRSYFRDTELALWWISIATDMCTLKIKAYFIQIKRCMELKPKTIEKYFKHLKNLNH